MPRPGVPLTAMKYQRTALLSIGLLALAATPASACFVGVQHGPTYETVPMDEVARWSLPAPTPPDGLHELGYLEGDDLRLQCYIETVNAELEEDEEEQDAGSGSGLLGLQPAPGATGSKGRSRGTRGGGTPPSMMTFLSPVGGGGLGGFFGSSGGSAGGGANNLAFVPGTDGENGEGQNGNPGLGQDDDEQNNVLPGGPGDPGDGIGGGDLLGGPGPEDIVTVVPEPGTAYMLSMFLLTAAGLSRRRRKRA